MLDPLAGRLRQLVDQMAPPLELSDLTDQMIGGPRVARPSLNRVLIASTLSALAVGVIVFVGTFDPDPAVTPSLPPPIGTTIPPPAASTTTTGTATGQNLRPRDIDPTFAQSPDWIEVAAAPIDMRFRDAGVAAWTGSEIVIWGGGSSFSSGLSDGAAYNPSTGDWRQMADSPFVGSVARFPGWVWTGERVLIWVNGAAATWDPATNTWQDLGEVPLAAGSFHRRAVWTGTEVIDTVGNIAFNPSTQSWRPIASPELSGMLEERSQAVWAQGRVVLLPSGPSYDPSADRWDPIENSGLSPNSVDGVSVGGVIVAVDYLIDGATYDIGADRWLSIDPPPLRSFECPIVLLAIGDRAVVDYCGEGAVYDTEAAAWASFAPPEAAPEWAPRFIAADTELYAFRDRLWRFVPDLSDPWNTVRRVTIGGLVIDLPDGWVSEPAIRSHELLRMRTASGGACMVAQFGGGNNAVDEFKRTGGTPTVVAPRIGGTPYHAVGGDGGHPSFPKTLMWAPPGEPLTFNCTTIAEAKTLFAHVLWIWEQPDE